MRGAVLTLVVLAALGVLGAASPALAERVVTTVSQQDIEVNSSFNGETLSFFGSIEPDRAAGQTEAKGPYHAIIVIEGPLTDRIARKKTNQLGIWLNTDQVVFQHFPSFFQVLASDKLLDITDIVTLTIENIEPDSPLRQPKEVDFDKAAVFNRELVRLMTDRELFGVHEQAVQFLSDTAYSARLILPGDIPNGPFIAHTFVFKDGVVVARSSEGFSVRKSGFERFLGLAAVQQPFLYGIACVILALGTGWLGGVVFRR